MTTQAYPGLHNRLFTCNSKAGKAGKNVSLVDLSSMQLWNTDHGKQKAVQALNDSLKRCVELCKNVTFSCVQCLLSAAGLSWIMLTST